MNTADGDQSKEERHESPIVGGNAPEAQPATLAATANPTRVTDLNAAQHLATFPVCTAAHDFELPANARVDVAVDGSWVGTHWEQADGSRIYVRQSARKDRGAPNPQTWRSRVDAAVGATIYERIVDRPSGYNHVRVDYRRTSVEITAQLPRPDLLQIALAFR